jgi:D-alanyl-D-alanine endopeptidase (penicillin-binding protein 7)
MVHTQRYLRLIFITGLLLLFNIVRADPLPNVTAQAWLVADEFGKIIQGTHTDEVRSIASITKLMTVMVVLDSNVSLTEILPKPLYNRKVDRQTLIDLAIVKSDNSAAKMLCDTYPGGYLECLTVMNAKAEKLQMYKTSFVDPTGLMSDNVSTAEDLIKLVKAASNYKVIVEASNKSHNTNTLVGKGYDFIVSKTGFISKAGGCIVFIINTVRGERTVVLLGSKNTKTRIPEAFLISALY